MIIGLCAVILMVMIVAVLRTFSKKIETKANEIYEKNKKDMLFNGIINVASINYLKMCEFVFDSLTSGAEVTFFSSLTIYGVLCLLVGYFIICSYVMIKTDNEDLLD